LLSVLQVTTTVDPYTNETIIVGTAMRANPIYKSVYVVWSKLVLTDLVPYFIIVVLNSFIVVKIIKSSRFRARILNTRNERQLQQGDVSNCIIEPALNFLGT
jgi:membrane-bound ClpP family serine protease